MAVGMDEPFGELPREPRAGSPWNARPIITTLDSISQSADPPAGRYPRGVTDSRRGGIVGPDTDNTDH
ncbi:hypothetical protein CcI49_05735 [Frankia sp. CcI49]|nr:hypothetical protein ACG83_19975 [Frankia sp. R43]ONH61690.1 hypothetical protein CcI49_05735 [Frankia sp. CcI49]